jgi:hypothetical protein
MEYSVLLRVEQPRRMTRSLGTGNDSPLVDFLLRAFGVGTDDTRLSLRGSYDLAKAAHIDLDLLMYAAIHVPLVRCMVDYLLPFTTLESHVWIAMCTGSGL